MKTVRRIAAFVAALLIAAPLVSAAGTFYESKQWNLEMIGAEAAFAQGALGQGIRVGVLDSGVSPGDAFGTRLLPGHNYIDGALICIRPWANACALSEVTPELP